MAARKEYTLKINGVDQAIKDFTTLEAAVKSFDNSINRTKEATISYAKAAKENTNTLTEEEKAERKLIDTIGKVERARSDANKAQIEANIAAREAQREVTREIQIRRQAEGSVKQMGMQLTDLRNKYESLSRAEREDITVGGELLQQIQVLDAEYKNLRESTGNFRDSVGNYEKATKGIGKLSDGIEGAAKSSMGLAQSLLGANALMALFGKTSEESAETQQKLMKIIALLSIAQQVNENVVKNGIVQGKLSIVTDTIRIAQIKAKTMAEAAATKGTIAATAAQKVFNAVASANPYVILALALAAVGTALYSFASGSKEARKEQARLSAEIEKTDRALQQLDEDGAYDISVMEVQGASALDLANKRRELAKAALEIAEANAEMILSNRHATDEQKQQAKELLEAREKAVKEANNAATLEDMRARKERAEKAKEALKTENEVVRAAQDTRLKLIKDSYARERQSIVTEYDRQIEDLRTRLATEMSLTRKARQAINDQIISLEILKDEALRQLRKNKEEEELEWEKKVEDSRIELISNNFDKEYAKTNLHYERMVNAYEKQKEELKNIEDPEERKKREDQINELILNARTAQGEALTALLAGQMKKRTDIELKGVENTLKKAKDKIGEVVARDDGGLQLIDAEQTRKNLDETNKALGKYIEGLEEYLKNLEMAHNAAISGMSSGSAEYAAEMQEYAEITENVKDKITDTTQQIEENTKKSKGIQIQAFGELFDKISEYAKKAVDAVSSVADIWNTGLQTQIDDLNNQMEVLDERYEEAQKKREDAAKNVEEIEKRMQDATGGTAIALKEQLDSATAARDEAAREEQRLAKEKEKREAEIARKEKQMRRNDLLSKIAQSIANVAAAVAEVLPNFVLAGIVGAFGAAKVGVMTYQLSKLEKGGEIKGPSHANGGVPIPGTNYEVEGGEFVVNKRSYGANANLVNFINDNPRTITTADLLGVVPDDAAPIVVSDAGRDSEDRIIEAINGINFKPVVSVTDINDVNDDVVTVTELTDF